MEINEQILRDNIIKWQKNHSGKLPKRDEMKKKDGYISSYYYQQYYKTRKWNLILKKLGFEPPNRLWINEELNFLKENYNKLSIQYLSKHLNRSYDDIYHKASELGLQKDYYWTKQDIDLAIELYKKGYTYEEIKQNLKNKFTINAIKSKLHKLGITHKDYWTEEEDNILRKNYDKMRICDLLVYFPNRSKEALVARAKKLGLKNCYYWTKKEDQFIRNNYMIMTDHEMAQKLNRTYRSVKWRRNLLKLNRETQGVYNTISEYLRKRIFQWKKDSLKSCNYKCVLTGKRANVVHHLYSFINIVKEIFESLDIDIKDDLSNYSEKELKAIEIKCLELHYKHGLGIGLCKELHDLFHMEYGYGYNTPQQFNEFKQRLFSGDFDDYLNFYNIHLIK